MNAEELKSVLDSHKKWLKDESGGKQANLTGADLTGADLARADLRGADLRGADLTGAKLNWNSHQLSSEILLRSAGKDPEKRKVAGLIRISPDWCWPQFLALDDPLTDWALDELAKWVQDGDSAPAVLVSRRKVSSSNCPQVVAVR